MNSSDININIAMMLIETNWVDFSLDFPHLEEECNRPSLSKRGYIDRAFYDILEKWSRCYLTSKNSALMRGRFY